MTFWDSFSLRWVEAFENQFVHQTREEAQRELFSECLESMNVSAFDEWVITVLLDQEARTLF